MTFHKNKRSFCLFIIFQTSFIFILLESGMAYNQHPEVHLTAAQFINKKHSLRVAQMTNKNPASIQLPKTFSQLEFTCTAPYPTEWVFQRPLLYESNIMTINITKARRITESIDDRSQYVFESKLLLMFKYSSRVPNFSCQSVLSVFDSDIGSDDFFSMNSDLEDTYFSTHISNNATETTVTVNFMKYMAHTSTRGENSQFCKYNLQFVDSVHQFRCTSSNFDDASFLPAHFVPTSSPDESNLRYHQGKYSCPKSNFLARDVSTLKNLKSITGSGIVTCGKDGALFIKYYYFPLYGMTKVATVNSPEEYLDDNAVVLNYEQDVYEKQNVEFTCKIPAFLFSNGIFWVFDDQFLKNDSDYSAGVPTEYKDQGLIVSKINIMFWSTNTFNVTCHAPVINSYGWINRTVQVKPKSGYSPKISDLTYISVTDAERESSYHEWTCVASGEPSPQFEWYMSNVNWTDLDLLVKNSAVKDYRLGCRILEHCFNIVTNGSISVFQLERMGANTNWRVKQENASCVAKNIFGEDHKTKLMRFFSWSDVIFTSIGAAVFLIIALVVACAYCKIKRIRELTDAEVDSFINGEPQSKDPTLWPYDTKFEINKEKFHIENTILGQGFSGVVKIGKFGSKIIAIKTAKTPTDSHYFQAMLKELKILCYVGSHENIVNLIGACTENIRKKEVFIMLEFCSNGSVLEYVRGSRELFVDRYHVEEYRSSYVQYQNGLNKNLTTRDLLRWASEIADGCAYLTARKVVHSDLAARNILVTDSLQAKVSDFGLSKELMHYQVYVRSQNCPLPLKWMAIESLQDFEFSLQSDIWSYGITLWEIFSLGDVPYPGIDWNFECYKLLQGGYRMERPKYSNDTVYQTMLQCWNVKPKMRPSFTELREFFKKARYDL